MRVVCCVLLFALLLATTYAFPWTDSFYITGIKSYNPNIDLYKGDKLVTIYYQNIPFNSSTTATTSRVRFDSTDLNSKGSVTSTTVVFNTKLYYVNLLSSSNHFCIFEHLYVKDDRSSFRLLPSTNGGKNSWVNSDDVKLVKSRQTLNATATHQFYQNVNVYEINAKSYTAQAWLYYALEYTGKGDFYTVFYYENADTGYPLRFEAKSVQEVSRYNKSNGPVDVTFDVASSQFYSETGVNDVFSDDLFNQNVLPSCH